ncbi:hypothetical protein BSKO_02089 [Bryopsis sp. KO-2023]|nr:hypothetical protein BSKO_02089 [Bryopsis sp. KO-2023]
MSAGERSDADKENLRVFSEPADSISGLCCRVVGTKSKQLRRRRRDRIPLQDITWMFVNKEETWSDREEPSTSEVSTSETSTSESSNESSTRSKRKREDSDSFCSGSPDEDRRKKAKAVLKKMR